MTSNNRKISSTQNISTKDSNDSPIKNFIPWGKFLKKKPEPIQQTKGLTELEFNNAIDRVEKIYRPLIEPFKKLEITRRFYPWCGTVDARSHADRDEDKLKIKMTGECEYNSQINQDVIYFGICHELGHHLGGHPLSESPDRNGNFQSWFSAEGQADYFAASKCLKKVFMLDNNVEIIKTIQIDSIVQQKCQQSYSIPEEIAICIRIAHVGKKFNEMALDKLRKNDPKNPQFNRDISFNTPSTQIVQNSITGLVEYPDAQCRLDTIFSGALCNLHPDDQNTCLKENNDNEINGTRPSCWFNSSKKWNDLTVNHIAQ